MTFSDVIDPHLNGKYIYWLVRKGFSFIFFSLTANVKRGSSPLNRLLLSIHLTLYKVTLHALCPHNNLAS